MEDELPLTLSEKLDLLSVGEIFKEEHPEQSLYSAARYLKLQTIEINKSRSLTDQKTIKKFIFRKGKFYRKF